jgi:hypothetical protein
MALAAICGRCCYCIHLLVVLSILDLALMMHSRASCWSGGGELMDQLVLIEFIVFVVEIGAPPVGQVVCNILPCCLIIYLCFML